jgi:hypothetical protein
MHTDIRRLDTDQSKQDYPTGLRDIVARCGTGSLPALRAHGGPTLPALPACSAHPGALAEWATAWGKPLHYCETCRDALKGELKR